MPFSLKSEYTREKVKTPENLRKDKLTLVLHSDLGNKRRIKSIDSDATKDGPPGAV